MSLRRPGRSLLVACLAFCLLVLFLAPVTSPDRALALTSSSPITITSQTATTQFPTSITFNAGASDPSSPIVSAQIVIDLRDNNGFTPHDVPLAAPLHNVKLSFVENTSGANFIPPGVTVMYYWHLTDSAGYSYLEPQQQITTVDTRFAWQHLSQGLLQVNWYSRAQDFGQSILSQASADISRISANLGGGLQQPINLWVYASDQDFHGSLSPNAYEWVGGIAFPSLDEASIVVAGLSDTTLVRDMPHELTHLIFHQLIPNALDPPTWFDEGLAVYNQLYHEPDMTARFQQALASHSLLRLGDISFGFPANADLAYLAYAQSWNLLQYMYTTFGQPKMAKFIQLMNAPSTDFSQAMQQSLGVDVPHLENQWRLSLGESSILTPDQITPTPVATRQPSHPGSQNNTGSTASGTTILVMLGGVLVLGSLVGLIALVVVVVVRNRRVPGIPGVPVVPLAPGASMTAAQTAPPWANMEQNSAWTPPTPYPPLAPPTPSAPPTYAGPPIAAQPATYAPPAQWPPYQQGQEYSGAAPRRQAPQE